jgi:phospholipase/carboxylesterase
MAAKSKMVKNTHSMIFLHGFTMKAEDMEYFTKKIDKILPKGVVMNYILPQAPKRKITCYKGKQYTAWYDYETELVTEEEKISHKDLKESRKFIHKLLDAEIKSLGDPKKVFLGGYSQGCCTMLDAGLTYPQSLGGMIGFKGHIPSFTDKSKTYKQNIWVCHGIKDDSIGYKVSKSSYDRYGKKGYDITFLSQDKVTHDMNSGILEEIRELKTWLTLS